MTLANHKDTEGTMNQSKLEARENECRDWFWSYVWLDEKVAQVF